MKTLKTALIALLAYLFFVSASNADEDLITKYLSLRISLDCETVVETRTYARVVADNALAIWLWNNPCRPKSINEFAMDRLVGGFDGSVMLQDACRLLTADPTGSITIYNALVEFSRDPAFDGVPCSFDGLFY